MVDPIFMVFALIALPTFAAAHHRMAAELRRRPSAAIARGVVCIIATSAVEWLHLAAVGLALLVGESLSWSASLTVALRIATVAGVISIGVGLGRLHRRQPSHLAQSRGN